jgi:hypothetical protein
MHNIVVPEVWVTTVTNRGWGYLPNVANNFKRQVYAKKHLCVILNSAELDEKQATEFFHEHEIKNVIVVSMPEATLGACLNKSIELMMKSNAWVWAKMDDDDYYGAKYLLVQGASLTVKKPVLAQIQFPDKNRGEDTGFLDAAKAKGYRIYVGPVSDYVVVRHDNNRHHTWKINLNKWLRNCLELNPAKTIEFEEEDHLYFPQQNPIVRPYLSGRII